jgi:hypothetical protein
MVDSADKLLGCYKETLTLVMFDFSEIPTVRHLSQDHTDGALENLFYLRK